MPGNDSFTKLLLHCDGRNTSTTFVDSSANAYSPAQVIGNAQISTAQSKFGGGSALFDGVGDGIQYSATTDWDFGTGDFTVDFWIRRNGQQPAFGVLFFTGGWGIGIGTTGADNPVYWTRTGVGVDIQDVSDLTDVTQTHIAVVRSGNTVTLYRAGSAVGTFNATGLSVSNGGTVLDIATSGSGNDFVGNLDEIRVSKGIARWTANFTPPTEAYATEYGWLAPDQYAGSAATAIRPLPQIVAY